MLIHITYFSVYIICVFTATHAGCILIIHWCRRRFSVFINAHVYIWVRTLGNIEEEFCTILIRIPGRPLSILRGIGRTIILVNILSVRMITCGCDGLQKLVGVKWEFDISPF